MQEHHLEVRRTARYYTLGSTGAHEIWIACHGYAQLARYFLRSFAPIADHSRCIVAPEALNRYYYETAPGEHAADARVAATWMTREDREHEIHDYIDYLDRLAEHVSAGAPRHIVAFGFSQGAATVSRWAARGTARIDDVILWAGAPAIELEGAALAMRGARLTLAIGSDDARIPPDEVERQDARLRRAGVEYGRIRYRGGHRIEPDALADAAARVRQAVT